METEVIRVTITRTEETTVFIRAPKGWRPDSDKNLPIIRAAAIDVPDCDWDKDDWQKNIEVHGWKRNVEQEAKGFPVFDATGGKEHTEKV